MKAGERAFPFAGHSIAPLGFSPPRKPNTCTTASVGSTFQANGVVDGTYALTAET